MRIIQRKLLDKIEVLHYKLLNRLKLSEKDELKYQRLYADYHNTINLKILNLELAKKKSDEQN